MSVTQITSEEEFTAAVNRPLVVVDFYATWCGPCKKIAPEIAKLAESNPAISFVKVDVDDLEELAAAQQIQSMPTFKVFSKGECVRQVIGANMDKLGKAISDVAQAVGIAGIQAKILLDVPAGTVFNIKVTDQLHALFNHPRVCLFFAASWCPLSKVAAPEFTDIAKKYPSIKCARIDVEDHDSSADALGVVSLPTFVFLAGGRETERVLGGKMSAVVEGMDGLLAAVIDEDE